MKQDSLEYYEACCAERDKLIAHAQISGNTQDWITAEAASNKAADAARIHGDSLSLSEREEWNRLRAQDCLNLLGGRDENA